MSFFKRRSAGAILFVAGIAGGIFLQHHSPAGRPCQEFLRRPIRARAAIETVASLPRGPRLVLAVAGPSNAWNHEPARFQPHA